MQLSALCMLRSRKRLVIFISAISIIASIVFLHTKTQHLFRLNVELLYGDNAAVHLKKMDALDRFLSPKHRILGITPAQFTVIEHGGDLTAPLAAVATNSAFIFLGSAPQVNGINSAVVIIANNNTVCDRMASPGNL